MATDSAGARDVEKASTITASAAAAIAAAASPSTSMSSSHAEKHVSYGLFVRDGIIGFADGLTVPFALTAGLSSLGSSRIVVVGGLAELFAGAISMGLGAYLAAATERKHYDVEEQRERREVAECPAHEKEEIYEILGRYGIARESARGVVDALVMDEDMWVQFMMDFELKLEKPARKIAWVEGLVMSVSYFLGGLLPMVPYFAIENVNHALFASIGTTAGVLMVFGYIKAFLTGTTHADAMWSAAQTLVVGALAAGVSYGIVRGVNSSEI